MHIIVEVSKAGTSGIESKQHSSLEGKERDN
jgi:hypothetical protein